MTRLADGVAKLVGEHLTLARLELAEDAKRLGRQLGLLLAFVPFVLVGYVFLCGALASALTQWMSWTAALASVGGVHILGGAIGLFVVIRRMGASPVMDETLQEFQRSTELLAGSPTVSRLEDGHGNPRGHAQS